MVLSQRSVPLALNLLNGERNGLAIGLMFAIAVTAVAKQIQKLGKKLGKKIGWLSRSPTTLIIKFLN